MARGRGRRRMFYSREEWDALLVDELSGWSYRRLIDWIIFQGRDQISAQLEEKFPQGYWDSEDETDTTVRRHDERWEDYVFNEELYDWNTTELVHWITVHTRNAISTQIEREEGFDTAYFYWEPEVESD